MAFDDTSIFLTSNEVEYIDHMGNDLKVVNAARISFNSLSEWADNENRILKDRDKNLINFLARGMSSKDYKKYLETIRDAEDFEVIEHCLKALNAQTHFTPFCHNTVTLHCKVPIFVARQLYKHQIGLTVNEVSRRYVNTNIQFYKPLEWRSAPENKKQGSGDEVITQIAYDGCYNADGSVEKDYVDIHEDFDRWCLEALEMYNNYIESGVAPEQARMMLPQNMMVEFWWTGSMLAFARMCNQRLDSHAQEETQDFARLVDPILYNLYPYSWEALVPNTNCK